MYALIKIGRRVLISPSEVISNVTADATLSIDKVQHSIIIAEERFVRTFLGWELYELLLNAKNQVVTDDNKVSLQASIDDTYKETITLKNGDIVNASEFLSADYKALWDYGLCKYIAEAVKFVAIPDAYAEWSESGIQKNNPAIPTLAENQERVAAIGLNEAKWLMDTWMNQRLEPLKNAIHTFICRNVTKYPGYIQPCECNDNRANAVAKSGYVVTSFYDDDEDCYSCGQTVSNEQTVATSYTQFTKQWVTVPGQTQYPYPGQFNETAIINELKGATLISLDQEGVNMYQGEGMGEYIGMDPASGRITWVTPAPDQETGLRMKAVLQR